MLRNIFRITIRVAWVALASLLLLELIFRQYWFDFYKPELDGLNPPEVLQQPADSTLLVFGDSYTASPNSYVATLRDSLKGWRVINCAVPGTSAREMSRLAATRIRQFRPRHAIVQVYIGNDLTDLDYPVNWLAGNPGRNLYWSLANRLQILRFLNFRTAHVLHARNDEKPHLLDTIPFETSRYNARERLYLTLAPKAIASSVNGRYKQAMPELTDYIRQIRRALPQDCRLSIVAIPHCAQVTDTWFERFTAMGMQADDSLMDPNPAFLRFLGDLSDRRTDIFYIQAALREQEAQGLETYHRHDPHLTSAGQQAVATWLLKNVTW